MIKGMGKLYRHWREQTTREVEKLVRQLVERYDRPGEVDIHLESAESESPIFLAATVYRHGTEAYSFSATLAIFVVRYNPDEDCAQTVITLFPEMKQEVRDLTDGLVRLEQIMKADNQ